MVADVNKVFISLRQYAALVATIKTQSIMFSLLEERSYIIETQN